MENWIQLSKMVPHSVLQKLLKGSACQKSALMDPYSMCTKVFRRPSWMSSSPLSGTKLFNPTLVITNVIGKIYQIQIMKSSITCYWENCIYRFTTLSFSRVGWGKCFVNMMKISPVARRNCSTMLTDSKHVISCSQYVFVTWLSCRGWGDLVVELEGNIAAKPVCVSAFIWETGLF